MLKKTFKCPGSHITWVTNVLAHEYSRFLTSLIWKVVILILIVILVVILKCLLIHHLSQLCLLPPILLSFLQFVWNGIHLHSRWDWFVLVVLRLCFVHHNEALVDTVAWFPEIYLQLWLELLDLTLPWCSWVITPNFQLLLFFSSPLMIRIILFDVQTFNWMSSST